MKIIAYDKLTCPLLYFFMFDSHKEREKAGSQSGGWLFVVYIILAIVIILAAIVIYGALSRKKIYRQIDQLESWKVDITQRPVTDELARVKRLKMVGETEEKFEIWRQEWDDILTAALPEAEEQLFEAEEAADKYRFSHAGSVLTTVHENLQQVEKRLETLLADLEELVSSEEQNRKDIVPVKAAYHEAKKQILTKRHLFQKARIPMEQVLQETDEDFRDYEEQTEQGNYLRARSILLTIKDHLDNLQGKMERIPSLFTELQTTLPDQIRELREGYLEMLEQGYILDHLRVEDELKTFEKRLQTQIDGVEQTEIEQPQEEIDDIHIRIESLYDQLENEVKSRQRVMAESATMNDRLAATEEEMGDLKNETEQVQESYHIEEEDLQTQQQLEKDLQQLRKKFTDSGEAIREQKLAFSLLQDQLESLKARLAELEEQQAQHKEMLQTLRKDEIKAKETLESLRQRLIEAKRMAQKSNLPGLPHHHWASLEATEEKISEIEEKLHQKPLEMPVIQQLLQEALDEVNHNFEQTKKLIEDAELAERLIQYGNRYRSRYPTVSVNLEAAESSFRNFHYEEALELAGYAVQQVEPDVLKEFDVRVEEESQ